jgi:hypothetical protein
MALQSLGIAVRWMAKSPYVWFSGIWATVVLLLAWYLFESFGGMKALSIVMMLVLVFPALIAGTYGIVVEHQSSFCVFRRYAVHGYFRQILPSILVFLIALSFSRFAFYVLLMFGFDMLASVQMAMFAFIPVMFFCYFADVTAVVNEKHVFASVEDSFLRVLNGLLSVAVFHLMNFALLLMVFFIGSFAFTAFVADTFLPLASMTEAELLVLTYDELLAIVSIPEVVFAGFAALSVCTMFFVPLFTLYKVCYFTKTSVFVQSESSVESEGVYDEKGRWYKYS